MSEPVQPVQQFMQKLDSIQKSPLKLRRMKACWPWYCTLDKCLRALTEEEVEHVKQQFPLYAQLKDTEKTDFRMRPLDPI